MSVDIRNDPVEDIRRLSESMHESVKECVRWEKFNLEYKALLGDIADVARHGRRVISVRRNRA